MRRKATQIAVAHGVQKAYNNIVYIASPALLARTPNNGYYVYVCVLFILYVYYILCVQKGYLVYSA